MKGNEQWFAFSVDLEPNKDDTLDGIRDAMEWFDETIPRFTSTRGSSDMNTTS